VKAKKQPPKTITEKQKAVPDRLKGSTQIARFFGQRFTIFRNAFQLPSIFTEILMKMTFQLYISL
jgi:hypothetical protein